jgi:hypothetical protein
MLERLFLAQASVRGAREAAQRDPGRDGRHLARPSRPRSSCTARARAADLVARLRRVRAATARLHRSIPCPMVPRRATCSASWSIPPVLPLADDRRRDQRSRRTSSRASCSEPDRCRHRHAAVRGRLTTRAARGAAHPVRAGSDDGDARLPWRRMLELGWWACSWPTSWAAPAPI